MLTFSCFPISASSTSSSVSTFVIYSLSHRLVHSTSPVTSFALTALLYGSRKPLIVDHHWTFLFILFLRVFLCREKIESLKSQLTSPAPAFSSLTPLFFSSVSLFRCLPFSVQFWQGNRQGNEQKRRKIKEKKRKQKDKQKEREKEDWRGERAPERRERANEDREMRRETREGEREQRRIEKERRWRRRVGWWEESRLD